MQSTSLDPMQEVFSTLLVKSKKQICSTTSTAAVGVGQVDNIAAVCQLSGNLLGSVDPAHFHNGIASLLHGLGDDGRGLCLTLRPRDNGNPLLLSAFDHSLLSFGLLQCNLLGLDGLHELPAKGEVSNSDVVKLKVKVLGALHHLLLDAPQDLGTFAEQLLGVVLGKDGLEHLISDGGQDALVEIRPQLLVQRR